MYLGPQHRGCQPLDIRDKEGRASLCFFAVPKFYRQIQDCAESRTYKGLTISKRGSHTSLISLIKICYEKHAPSLECASLELTVSTVLPRNVSIPGVCKMDTWNYIYGQTLHCHKGILKGCHIYQGLLK